MSEPLNLEIQRGLTFGPIEVYCKADDGTPFPLAGWSAASQAGQYPGSTAAIDLRPVIAEDDADGLITIPEITFADASALTLGDFTFDLVLIDPDGKRPCVLLGGTVTVTDINTSTFPEHQTHTTT